MTINPGFVILTCLASSSVIVVQAESEPLGETSERISCYTCGFEEFSPESDRPNSYCDLDRNDNCPDGSKMYNHTCDIMDRLGASDAWSRECPDGVRSCFYSTSRYEDQAPVFRGCAGARYEYDEKCSQELQSVSVVENRRSVDVEVNLCYCTGSNCNEILSGAHITKAALFMISVTATLAFFLA